jgi:hypothetical protein
MNKIVEYSCTVRKFTMMERATTVREKNETLENKNAANPVNQRKTLCFLANLNLLLEQIIETDEGRCCYYSG